MTADELIYTTLSTWSMCVLLALLLCRVTHRWHGGFHCNVHVVHTQCKQKHTKTKMRHLCCFLLRGSLQPF